MPLIIAKSGKPIILVVDDTPDNLTLMSGLLKDTYKVKVANSGEKALKIIRSESPPRPHIVGYYDAGDGRV